MSSHHGGTNPQSLTTPHLVAKWAHWCGDPFSGPISDVANFLTEPFEQGYQYSSLNAYRSSISFTHKKVDGQPFGQHPTIVKLLKGAYNNRPPLPTGGS